MPTNATQAADLIAEECLAVRVRLLSRTITGIYDDALRPVGLTTGQLNILVVITKRAPISPGEVARRLNMKKSTVSRNVELMRSNGWLTVTPGKSGRKQLLALTRKGKTLLEKSVPAWEEAQTQARAALGLRGAQSIHKVASTVWGRIGRV
jgi:DNA-binding MarR family transcriptional regulator